MFARISILILTALASAAYAYERPFHGLTYEGIIHSDGAERRASPFAYGKIYRLDFRGVDLYQVTDRHNRERVIIRGRVEFPQFENRPVLHVESITFRPYGRAVTYNIDTVERFVRRRYNTSDKPYLKERTVIREYDYNYR